MAESTERIDIELEQRVIKTALGRPNMLRSLDAALFGGELERELFDYLAREETLDGFAELARGKADREIRKVLISEVSSLGVYKTRDTREQAVAKLDDLRVLREVEPIRDRLESALDNSEADAIRELLPGMSRTTIDSGDYIEDFEGRKKNQGSKEEEHLVKTGFWELDERIGGLRRKEVGILVGTSSSGKSMALLQMAASAWLAGRSVLLFGLEMSREENELRLDAMLTQIDAMRFRRQNLTDADLKAWAREIQHYKQATKKGGLQFASKRGATLEDVFAEMDRTEQRRGKALDLLVLDWLGLVKGKGWREQRHEKETRHADELCEMALDRNMGIWTAAQSTDEGYSAKGGLKITNLKYGRGVAETMPVVFGLDSTKEHEAMGEVGLTCLKARGGPRGWTMLMRPDWTRNVMDMKSWHLQNVRAMTQFQRGGKKK